MVLSALKIKKYLVVPLFFFLFFFLLFFFNLPQSFAHNASCTDVDEECINLSGGTCGGIGCSASAPPGLCNWKWGNMTRTGSCRDKASGLIIRTCSRDEICCCGGQAAGACACNVTCSGSSSRASPSCVGASGWDVYSF